MSELIRKDITIKTISILFAIILWFYVLDSANPFKTETLYVTLRVVNENALQDKDIVLINQDLKKRIGVTIKARKDVINNVSVNDFEAVLDLAKIQDENSGSLRIDGPVYNGKEDISIESVEPRVINLDLEKIQKNQFYIDVVPKGKVKKGYTITDVSTNPQSVTIEALDSVIKSIDAVKTVVDVENLDRDLVIKKGCTVYDKNGKEMPELSKNLNVEVTIQVAKEVYIKPVVRGNPAKDHIMVSSKVEPVKALITGAPGVLSRIYELETEVVVIDGVDQSMTRKVPLLLPQGVKLVDTPREVNVSVAIEKLAKKEISITAEDISIQNEKEDGTLDYQIAVEGMVIGITGKKDDIEKLEVGDLKPTIDVEGLAEGTTKVPLQFSLPANVKLGQDYTIEINVEKVAGSESDEVDHQ